MNSKTARVPAPRVEGLGEVSTGCLVWRTPNRFCATLVVKATFTFVPDGPMRRVAPEPLIVDEQNYDQSPVRSVKRTTDMALFTPRTDVVLTGNAEVPEGRWAPRLPVRLAVYRGEALLDKTLLVYGDRQSGQPKPFQRMPLTYEKAYGGLGFPENPFGTGIDGGKLPNIEMPGSPQTVAGFGPIGRSLSARRNRLDPVVRKRVISEVPEVGENFDWSYFQAAPPDQQIPLVVGDEWIVLEGMSALQARLQSCLPGVCAEMFLHGPDLIDPTPVGPTTFRADIVRIDTAARLCSVTWRAVICTAQPEQLDLVRVMVGVAEREAPISWPAPAVILARWEAEDAEFLDANDVSEVVSTSRAPMSRLPDHTITLSGTLPQGGTPPPMPFAALGTTPRNDPPPTPSDLTLALPPTDRTLALPAPTENTAPKQAEPTGRPKSLPPPRPVATPSPPSPNRVDCRHLNLPTNFRYQQLSPPRPSSLEQAIFPPHLRGMPHLSPVLQR